MVNLKAGKYYVGDLCYVINDKHWDELGEQTDWFQKGNNFQFKEQTVFVSGTAHGDGRFSDNSGRVYCVDAGLIGVIPFDVIDDNFEGKGGQIIEFEKDFTAHEGKGIFYIGNIEIDTYGWDEEEEEHWDEDENEDDE